MELEQARFGTSTNRSFEPAAATVACADCTTSLGGNVPGMRGASGGGTRSVRGGNVRLLQLDLLRHRLPSGDLGEIFDRALTRLLEEPK